MSSKEAIAERYKKLLSKQRRRKSSAPPNRTVALEAASDRGRVLFSASFRRLQLKTQVFPQEWNAAVRTRLSHSLEVASVGRFLAEKIADKLVAKGYLGDPGGAVSHQLSSALVTFVEVACLMHDLGNPPFGHFGEASIRDWFCQREHEFRARFKDGALFDELFSDFRNFDGNPQGFRMATRLQWINDEFGYNLTLTQLAAMLKYPWSPLEVGHRRDGSTIKKAGVFCSESNILSDLQRKLSLEPGSRHPLAYIMEAADDISYCLSDIEDALEKGVVTGEDVVSALTAGLGKLKSPNAKAILGSIPRPGEVGRETAWFVGFRTTVTNELVHQGASLYVKHHAEILEGKYFQLLSKSPTAKALLEVVAKFSTDRLYTSNVIRERELVGFQVTCGILDKFGQLLDLSTTDAVNLLAAEAVAPKGRMPLAATLRSFLPKKHLKVYQHSIGVLKSSSESPDKRDVREWAARAHLIVDYLSGMTDDFAIVMHRKLHGGGVHHL